MGVYNAEISAGSLMLPESRRIAGLLLTHPSREQWLDALKLDNLLQKRTPATARRQAQLIRKRLQTLAECVQRDPELANLSASTKAKVLQVILRVLAEGRYVDSTRTLRLTPPHLHPAVVSYLKRHGESEVLAIMDMSR
jgi:ABC-type sugar transport system ATPase subunit